MNTPSTRPRLHGKRPGRRGLAAVWLVACAAAAVLIVLLWISLGFLRPSQAGKADRPAARRVMVLGIDAMDYSLTRRLMAEGRLPHFASLAEEGSFGPLETSMPPLSPVAWTTFATGTNPGGHGVFDFLRCDPARLGEGFPCDDAASEVVTDPVARPRAVPLTDYVLPAESHRRLRRRAPAFWDLLTDAGVKAVIYKIPANFPATARKARTLSGMGTVDVAGTYGAFLFLSDRPIDWARRTTGGRIVKARLQDGVVEAMDQHGKWARPMLYGPANPFLPEEADSADRLVTVPFDVFVDCEAHTAAIVLSDDELTGHGTV